MKRFVFFTLASISILAACKDSKTPAEPAFKTLPNGGIVLLDTANMTKIQWVDTSLNLGRVNEGEKIEVAFRFKNADVPLRNVPRLQLHQVKMEW